MTVTERKSRIEELARPRGLHPDYKEDRVSVYWVDRLPLLPSNGRTRTNLTSRQEELVQPKRRDPDNGFCEPMWPVSRSAMMYEPSPRIYDLARHKLPPADYVPRRPVQTEINDGALRAEPTPRVSELAQSKKYFTLPIIMPKRWDWTDWEDRIPPPALKAQSSERVETLATPKTCPASFRPAKSCMWPVVGKNAETTEHVTKLAMPRARTMIKDDYDPYVISKATLRANITPRVEVLAAPLPRKTVSSK